METTEEKPSLYGIEKQMDTWLKEIFSYKPDEQAKQHFLKEDFRLDFEEGGNGFKYILFTHNYEYEIIATSRYLGSGYLVRKPRAGEDWQRGRDLKDGKFTQETWDKIKNDIIRNELVKISKLILDEKDGIEPKADIVIDASDFKGQKLTTAQYEHFYALSEHHRDEYLQHLKQKN